MKYTILYQYHGENKWYEWSIDHAVNKSLKERAIEVKDKLLNSKKCKTIKVMFTKDGLTNCVFDGVKLV